MFKVERALYKYLAVSWHGHFIFIDVNKQVVANIAT